MSLLILLHALLLHIFGPDRHEHLYEELLEPNVVRSDEFKSDIVDTHNLLGGSRVLLCTLSMLSNPKLDEGGFTRLVPVDIVIIDEASQIEVGDYLPVLSQYRSSIQKLVFIGDDKQCRFPSTVVQTCLLMSDLVVAPYGQDDLNDLRSVFEMPNIRKDALFLDTQCGCSYRSR